MKNLFITSLATFLLIGQVSAQTFTEPVGTNYMPMSPYWKLTNDSSLASVGASYDATTKTVNFPVVAQPIYVRDTSGSSVQVPSTMSGKKFFFTVKATGGAKLRIGFKTSSYTNAYTTPYLGNGETHIFTMPADRYGVPEGISGTTSASSIRGYLVEAQDIALSYSASTGLSGKVGTAMKITPSTLTSPTSPITSCTAAPALPAGLSINNSTCVVSGTPTATLPSTTYVVTAKNVISSVSADLSFNVAGAVPVFDYSSSTGKDGKVGDPMNVAPSTFKPGSSPVTSCTITPALPAGLSINNTTCVISGTPTVVSAASRRQVTATSAAGSSAAMQVTLSVAANSPLLAYSSTVVSGNTGKALTINPTTLNNRGAAISACTVSPALPAGLTINNTTCVISGTPTASVASSEYAVIVKNSAGSGSATVKLSIAAPVAVVNCVGSYSTCTKTCGGGTQTFTITTQASGGGTACVAANGSTRSCNTQACPVNCVGSWGACSKTCGGGTQTYTITTPASGGGAACSAANGATQACNTQSCTASAKYNTFENPYNRESPWNIRPVNPKFGTFVIPADTYKPMIASGGWSTAMFKALSTDTPMTIYPRGTNTSVKDPGSEGSLPSVTVPRWPKDLEAAAEADGHADFLDSVTGIVHSFWQLSFNTDRNRWEAEQWTTTDLNGRGWGDPAKYMQGPRAAGVPSAGGLIRKHETQDGKDQYDHVLTMSMAHKGLSPTAPGYIFPATSADFDYNKNTGKIPEGALMMLPPTFDLSKLSKPHNRKVAKTLMTYGVRVTDRNTGTPYNIYIENGAVTGVGSWDTAYYNDLDIIRAALRQVVSQDGWVDKDGVAVTSMDSNAQGYGLNNLCLRGPWTKAAGDVAPVYDSATDSLIFGATGATASTYEQKASGGYNNVAWSQLIVGAKYRFSVTSTNGAKITITFRGGSYESLLDVSGTNGTVKEFVHPGGWITMKATSGVNASSSMIKVKLEKIP